eukprot:2706657-Rhodomonas_salina.2
MPQVEVGMEGRDSENNAAEFKKSDEVKDEGPAPSLGRVLGLAREESCILLAAFILQCFSELGGLATPLLIAQVYDAVVEDLKDGRDIDAVRSDITKFMAAVIIVHALSMFLAFFRGLLTGVAGERIVARLRNRLFLHLLSQNMAFFDSRKSGELVSRLGSDSTLVQMGTTQALTEAAMGLIKAVVSVGLMFSISWHLTTAVFLVCIILLLFSIPVAKWIGEITTSYQDALGKAAMVSTEALGGMRTLRSFGCKEVEHERYRQHIGAPAAFWPPKQQATLYHGARKALAFSSFFSIGFFVGLGSLYGSLWYGFVLYTQDKISIGGLSAFQSYIFQVGFAFASLGHNVTRVFEAFGGARRILELLDHEQDLTETSGTVRPAEMKGEVVFDDVNFAYASRLEKQVLTKFTLHVPAQSVAAIVGSSGSGKSTVLALLARFYQPKSGRIMIDNIQIQDLDIRWLRRHVALVQQEPLLFGMSIWDNVCYGRHDNPPSEEEVVHVCQQANAHEFISTFPEQYHTLVGERGVKLSGGQKQRIAIARALILSPRILLLDEATSALDAESERLVQEAIDRTMVGRTVLVVAHRLSTVRDAHQIAVSSEGSVVDVGSHQELLARCEQYQTLVKRQTDQLAE